MLKQLWAVPLVLATGCWTVMDTEFPSAQAVAIPAGRDLRVQVAGFDATVTTYETAYSYSTVFGVTDYWGYWGRPRPRIGTTTYATTEIVPHTQPTAYYRDRATDTLERAGCILRSSDPQYRVEVRFGGPFSESGDGWATFGWMVLSVFTAEYAAQDWSAQLRIHDLKSGKLIFSHDYRQRDRAVVWGPIPIFSPGCSERTDFSVMKGNCLTALTDLAVADALSFLSQH